MVTQYVPVIADQQDFIDVLGARMNDGRDALNWLRGFLPRMCQQMATMASNSELVQMLMREQVHE